MAFFAHSGTPDSLEDWQRLPDHLQNVASLAGLFAKPFGLERAAFVAGLLHDIGKYHADFQAKLHGADNRFDHSTAGGRLLLEQTLTPLDKRMAEIVAHAILGHHAGLPDTMDRKGGSEASLRQRLEKPLRIDPAWKTDIALNASGLAPEAIRAIHSNGFALSFMGRMIFSCLVDADRKDTEAYYISIGEKQADRNWARLDGLLTEFRSRFEAKIEGFGRPETDIDRLRADILSHVRAGAEREPGLFTLTVPTGGGKTLASLGFALNHAARHGRNRIIYAIPFTSIIDQTAAIFRSMLGEAHVLEHHSAIDEDSSGKREAREQRDKLKLAMEDWGAPVVVTTNVQFFESLFSARPSRARKLHNIAGSVIILDEAQTIPRDYLIPCMRVLEELTLRYGCTVVLCTATQPALVRRPGFDFGLPLEGRELAPDPAHLAECFARNRIVHAGPMDNTALVEALRENEQALVIVNSRRHALELYEEMTAAGLEGVIHLTTRQYAAHRKRILKDVRQRLAGKMPCRLIATSLIEAGVDVDFPIAFRAEAGLEQIVQAAGRVNREGKAERDASVVTVFEAVGYGIPYEIKARAQDMRKMIGRHADLSMPAAIEDYFEEVYWRVGADELDKKKILEKLTASLRDISFCYRTIGEDFRMIESGLAPLVVAVEPEAEKAVNDLESPQIPSGKLARELQSYVVQIPPKARYALIQNGKASFKARDLRGDQFVVLTDNRLYTAETGLRWEDPHYLSVEDTMM